jgi:hypothetical protein
MLRSSADHRYAQVRSRVEDSYEDADEDEDEDDDDDVGDDGDNIRDEEDDDDEENEDEEMLNRGRHPHRNQKSGTPGDNVTWVSEASLSYSVSPMSDVDVSVSGVS